MDNSNNKFKKFINFYIIFFISIALVAIDPAKSAIDQRGPLTDEGKGDTR